MEIVRAERPDVVLLDVMMPVMNGFDVCRTIKDSEDLRDTYVVLLTAKGQEFDRTTGAAAGADVYVTKPFDPDSVLQRTAEVLGIEL